MKIQSTLFSKIYIPFLVALLWVPMIGYGQTSKCFNLEKIKKMYTSTFLEINSMLFRENWEIIANSNQAPFVFGNDTLMYDNFSQWIYQLSVDKWFVSQYRKKEHDPILVIQTSKTCYETLESELQKSKSIAQIIMEDSVQRLRIFQVREGMDIVFPPRRSRQPYIIIAGNYTQISSLIKVQNAEKEEYEKTLQKQQQLIQTAMEQVDSLRNMEDYENAMLVLKQIANQHFIEREELIIEFQEVSNKIDAVKKELDIKNFNLHIQLADEAFAAGKYALAKEHLLKAQQIDPTSPIVLQKLKEIEKVESMFLIRKDTIFDYALYNRKTSDEIRSDIFEKLRNYFLNVDAGDIQFTYTLHTDTLGQNVSSHQIKVFSLRPNVKLSFPISTEATWSLFLDTLFILRPIPAVTIDHLYVNAATTFQNTSSWNSSLVKVSNGGRRIRISPHNVPVAEKRTLEKYFLSNHSFPKGKYIIEKKRIAHQDSLYTTLALKKIYTVGPEAMLYSMLFPGAGSLAATQGKKGWGAFSTFIIFGGIGVAGLLVADKVEMSSNTSKTIKYVSYGSLGVAGVIYICDVFIALKRGIDNQKKSRAIKAKLKEDTLFIQEFPRQIEF
jgi:tetratricopeptide (TPR) repeat protein